MPLSTVSKIGSSISLSFGQPDEDERAPARAASRSACSKAFGETAAGDRHVRPAELLDLRDGVLLAGVDDVVRAELLGQSSFSS